MTETDEARLVAIPPKDTAMDADLERPETGSAFELVSREFTRKSNARGTFPLKKNPIECALNPDGQPAK